MTERKGEAGFTLVETLVALAILGIALPVLLASLGNALRQTKESEARLVAASYAESLLASAGVEKPLQIGQTQGEFDAGYHWALSVAPYEEPGSIDAWSVKAYLVTATVSWSNAHAIALKTLRFAPKERVQ
jgi:general secretion pathway protein I